MIQKNHLLTVTREMTQDKMYGLGKSLAPIHAQLKLLGWEVTYFSQADLSPAQLDSRNRLIKLGQALLLARRFKCEDLVSAFIERLNMGYRAACEQQRLGATHVHLHDPWLALGYLLSQPLIGLCVWRGALGPSTEKPFTGRVRVFLTQHGFGAYCEAVRMDGVHIGSKAMRIMKVLEKWVCSQMTWVIAPTQTSLDRLAVDLGIFTQARANKDKVLAKTHQGHQQGAGKGDAKASIARIVPISTLAPMANPPRHWIKILHALPAHQHLDPLQSKVTLQIPIDCTVILSVGRLAALKQFDVIIGVFAQLCDQWKNLHLIILGDGDRSSLIALAESLGVASKITFAASPEVDVYYSAANVYVIASLTESFGLANLEALSHGLPCLCTRVGGVPEVVQDAALLVKPKASELLNGLCTMLIDAQQNDALIKTSQELVARWPSLQQITQTYVQVYQSNPSPT